MKHYEGRISNFIVSLRVFGSVARGDADTNSDLDILAVLYNRRKPPDTQVIGLIKNLYGLDCNISWYSRKRIIELYKQGHLFAWHIFQESKKILTGQDADLIDQLGIPSAYSTANEDISSLIAILSSIKKELNLCERNLVYEAGLIYVCLRNISLSASFILSEKLDFSRYSPFNLPNHLCQFPLSRGDYEILVQSRHSSMRGGTPPMLNIHDLLNKQDAALKWAQVIQKLGRRNGDVC